MKCEGCGATISGNLHPRLCWKCWDADQDRRHENEEYERLRRTETPAVRGIDDECDVEADEHE